MPITTIQLDTRTRKRLAGLKASPKETYDELLTKLMRLVPEGDDEGRFSDRFRAGLLEGMVESLEGKTIPMEDVVRLLGMKAA
jgi:hypothetical protein